MNYIADKTDYANLLNYIKSVGGVIYCSGKKLWIDDVEEILDSLYLKVFSRKSDDPQELGSYILIRPFQSKGIAGIVTIENKADQELNRIFRSVRSYLKKNFIWNANEHYFVGSSIHRRWMNHDYILHIASLYKKRLLIWFDSKEAMETEKATFLHAFHQKGYCIEFRSRYKSDKTSTEKVKEDVQIIYPNGANVITIERDIRETPWLPYNKWVFVSSESDVIFFDARKRRYKSKERWLLSFSMNIRPWLETEINTPLKELYSEIHAFFDNSLPKETVEEIEDYQL